MWLRHETCLTGESVQLQVVRGRVRTKKCRSLQIRSQLQDSPSLHGMGAEPL